MDDVLYFFGSIVMLIGTGAWFGGVSNPQNYYFIGIGFILSAIYNKKG